MAIPRAGLSVAALLAAFVLAGCGAGSSAASAPASATAIGSPTSNPSPSAIPASGTTALSRLADPQAQLRATITGTLDVGQTATVKGVYEQRGRDFHLRLDTTLAAVSFTVEQMTVAENSYILAPGRPWHHDQDVSGIHRAPTLAEALASTRATGPDGGATIGGAKVDRYTFDGLVMGNLTAALGLSDPGVTPTATSSTLFASADGTPVALDLRYTVPTSDGTPTTSDLRFTLEWGGPPISITAPADPWLKKAAGHGYGMWYPETWRAELDPSVGEFTDNFIGRDASVTVYCVPNARLNLKAWAGDGLVLYTNRFGGTPNSSEDSKLGDIPVSITSWNKGTVNGEPRTIVNVALVNGPVGCDVQWFRAPGPSGEQDLTFRTFLTTFSLD